MMRKIFHLLLILALPAVLPGCMRFHSRPLSPEQTASAFEARSLDNPELQQFIAANLPQAADPWPPTAWDFARLTLAAFYYHPDLDVARAKWGAAQAGVKTAGGRPNPSLSLAPEYGSNPNPSPWVLGLSLDIPIETAGKRGYRIAEAKNLSESARLDLAQTAWEVRSRLRERLVEWRAAVERQARLQEQREIQEQIVKVLELRLEAGEASRPEVTLAEIALDQIRLAELETRKQSGQARVLVADALGLPVSALSGAAISWAEFESPPASGDLVSQDARRQALQNRADLLSALAEYAASQSVLQLEIARQYPDLHLGPGYTYDQGQDKWALGLSLELPVLNRNRGPIAGAEAHRAEAAAKFISLQARILGEIEQAAAGYEAALQQQETADALVQSHQAQVDSAQAQLERGEFDRLDVLSARVELAAAELGRLDAWLKAQAALGLLEDAIERPLGPAVSPWAVPEKNPREKSENRQ
jgi:outer membrane protein, heavy metal efflux system